MARASARSPSPFPACSDPDPSRIVAGYFHSAATLNYARALMASGLGDLHSASHWDLGFVQARAQEGGGVLLCPQPPNCSPRFGGG